MSGDRASLAGFIPFLVKLGNSLDHFRLQLTHLLTSLEL